MTDVSLRKLTTMSELERMQELEELVWGIQPVPLHQLHTVAENGGLIVGAFDKDSLVGFSYGFPGFSEGRVYLCSHMLAVHPDYHNKRIGETLKQEQRRLAAELGYNLLTWTYDPLETRNAYLNLHKLKGIGAAQLPNHYGEMEDTLNAGLPTDRFLVEWWIDSPHVSAPDNLVQVPPVTVERSLLSVGTNDVGSPKVIGTGTLRNDGDVWFVPVPDAFQLLKQQDLSLAHDWRTKTRHLFDQLFRNGYAAVDIVREREAGVCHYVFVPRHTLEISKMTRGFGFFVD